MNGARLVLMVVLLAGEVSGFYNVSLVSLPPGGDSRPGLVMT
jgi:hypothetical protein